MWFLYFLIPQKKNLRASLMMQKKETVNVRVPEEIALWIDSLVEKKLFSSRSEVIRHFMREYVMEQKRNPQINSSADALNRQSRGGIQ